MWSPGSRILVLLSEAARSKASKDPWSSPKSESLAIETISARGRLYVRVNRAEVKWRYRSPAVPAAVEETEQGFRLALDAPAYGVAAGQTAVLYDDDVVVGAGLL